MEAGLFILIVSIAFGAMILGFIRIKAGAGAGMFHLVAVALFLIMYITLSSGEEVEATSTATITDNDGTTWTEDRTKILLPGGETSAWAGFVFLGFGVLNFIVSIRAFYEGS